MHKTKDHSTTDATAKRFPITFGSASGTDKFGFVREGSLAVGTETVELAGPKHWSGLARAGIFIVLWPLIAAVVNLFQKAFSNDTAIGNLAGAITGVILIFGSPCIALVLIHYFCASPGRVSWQKSQLTNVLRSGRQISFMAPLQSPAKLGKALFRASTEGFAGEIERELRA